ncbi:MAG: diguanylate cyclase [Gallionella sp.]|nr:diguanylate cyclase [Gallionella sp.]MDD4959962.1 diguanylate cyclase [Gallionella sp.]
MIKIISKNMLALNKPAHTRFLTGLWLSLGIAFFLLFFSSNGTGAESSTHQSPPLTQPHFQTQKAILVVGSEQDYPPFATGMTDATAGGFTVDLWKAVAKEANLNFTLHVAPFHEILQDFKDGKIDVLINLAHSAERHRFADFTVPHVIIHGAIFVHKDNAVIHSENELANKSIIVIKADLAHDYALSKGWEKQLVLVGTAAEGLNLLASGKHDAMLLGKLTGIKTLRELELNTIEARAQAGFAQKFAFAVREGQSELLGKLNEGLAITKTDGTYDALYEKWFGLYQDQTVGWRILTPIMLFFLVISSYLLYKHRAEKLAFELKLHTLYAAIEQSPISIVITDADANIEYVNPSFTEVSGYPLRETIGQNPRILKSGLTPNETYLALWRALTSGQVWQGELINKRQNGEIYWEEAHISPVKNKAGILTHYVAAKVDITQRKQSEEAIRQSEERFRFMLENSPIAVRITQCATCQVVFANQRYAELVALTPDEVIGINPKQYYANPQEYEDVLAQIREAGNVTNKLVELHIPSGHLTTKWVLASYLQLDYRGDPSVLGWFYDISDRKAMEEQIQHLAHYDPLTNLPNRTLFEARLQQALTAAKRTHLHLALMFLDLDKFKPINDTLGHGVGDLVLIEVARRIQACLRESDTVARIGGDEFVVLLPIVETEQDAIGVAEKIRQVLNLPMALAGHDLQISSSTGIALYPEHGTEENQLIKNADTAMYYAKTIGRDAVKLYQENMQRMDM